MTTEEKIKVMQAYVDGKQIETRFATRDNDPWKNCINPVWNWLHKEYRIKPEAKELTYRPYKDTEEMIADYKERFKANVPPYAVPLIWVRSKLSKHTKGELITIFEDNSIYFGLTEMPMSMNELLMNYVYLDGSPVGKEVEE